MFVGGVLEVELVARCRGTDASPTPAWSVHDRRRRAAQPDARLRPLHRRRAPRPTRPRTTASPIGIGPLTLTDPSIGLADTKFKDGKLVLTIAIGVDAGDASASAAAVARSGVSAKLTRHARHLRHHVDVAKAAGAISNPSASAQRVQRARQVRAQRQHARGHRRRTSSRSPPAASRSTTTRTTRRPTHGGKAQDARRRQHGPDLVPAFGVTGLDRAVHRRQRHADQPDRRHDASPASSSAPTASSSATAELIYRPGRRRAPPQQDQLRLDPRVRRPAGRRPELRRHVRPRQVDFSGDDLLRLRRRHVPARQADLRLDHRPHDRRADRHLPRLPDTEAVRATLEFDADGSVKAFKFKADTLKITSARS